MRANAPKSNGVIFGSHRYPAPPSGFNLGQYAGKSVCDKTSFTNSTSVVAKAHWTNCGVLIRGLVVRSHQSSLIGFSLKVNVDDVLSVLTKEINSPAWLPGLASKLSCADAVLLPPTSSPLWKLKIGNRHSCSGRAVKTTSELHIQKVGKMNNATQLKNYQKNDLNGYLRAVSCYLCGLVLRISLSIRFHTLCHQARQLQSSFSSRICVNGLTSCVCMTSKLSIVTK